MQAGAGTHRKSIPGPSVALVGFRRQIRCLLRLGALRVAFSSLGATMIEAARSLRAQMDAK
jgi:hypothetical protein